MTSWEDVAKEGIDFLQKPTGLGVAVVAMLVILLMYLTPLGVLTYLNIDGTNRIVAAINQLRTDMQQTGQHVASKN